MPDSQEQAGDARREERPLQCVDRSLEKLIGELRVVVTGVQVLFAFLLVVPYDTGFSRVGSFGRAVYFVTLLLTAVSAICTIAPVAQHRLLFRHGDKPRPAVHGVLWFGWPAHRAASRR